MLLSLHDLEFLNSLQIVKPLLGSSDDVSENRCKLIMPLHQKWLHIIIS